MCQYREICLDQAFCPLSLLILTIIATCFKHLATLGMLLLYSRSSSWKRISSLTPYSFICFMSVLICIKYCLASALNILNPSTLFTLHLAKSSEPPNPSEKSFSTELNESDRIRLRQEGQTFQSFDLCLTIKPHFDKTVPSEIQSSKLIF